MKMYSWPNWNASIVGYSPFRCRARCPSSQATGAQFGCFSGMSNERAQRSVLRVADDDQRRVVGEQHDQRLTAATCP
jgi:hypothetical protein